MVAIGRRLARFPWITTLGLRPNLDDYPPEHFWLIRQAQTIYYPTNAFAEMFHSQGKRIFPSLESHLYDGDKIKQTTLFKLLGLPHPRTRVFYGRQRQEILEHFSYPFVAKKARGSARGQGVYLIKGPEDLAAYLERHQPAYIQEYLPIKGDVRVVVIGFEPVCAYWRLPMPGDFRSNVARGARVEFDGVPRAAVELAVETARLANLDEVGLDVAMLEGRPYLLEFNVKYGHQGPRQAGLDVAELVARKILAGEL
ncbi:MAG: ATP-grasp domain-containing protein [Desulfarculus sp.]|nr:ATP-grasp domain-containing protein [Desulfarculus sp.]